MLPLWNTKTFEWGPMMKNEDKKVVIKMWALVSSIDKVSYCQIQNIGLKTAYTKNQLVSLPNNKI